MFSLSIKTDNAAFSTEENGHHGETAAILRKLADRLENMGGTHGPLSDSNGNTVGNWTLDEPREGGSLAPGEFSKAILAGYTVEKWPGGAAGWSAEGPDGEGLGSHHDTERAAWAACDAHRLGEGA